jgi:hypothetical protein
MKRRAFRILIALASACLALGIAGRSIADDAPKSSTTSGSVEGRLVAVLQGGSLIRLELPAPLMTRDLPVVGDAAQGAAQAKLAKAQSGDTIKINVDDKSNPQRIMGIEEIKRPISRWWRLLALLTAFVVLLALAALVTRGAPANFLLGFDNRYSNSQCQLAIWFGVVATAYLAAVALRIVSLGSDFVGGVGLPENLIALTGLSAFTFGGAKVITAQKVAAAEQANLPPPKPSAAKSNLLTDLVQNDRGAADLGDFQMIMIALAAALIFLLSAFHFLGTLSLETQVMLPDVDTTLLSGFGLGQGACLIKKAALKAGEG